MNKLQQEMLEYIKKHGTVKSSQLHGRFNSYAGSTVTNAVFHLIRVGKVARLGKGVYGLQKKFVDESLPVCAFCGENFTISDDTAFCGTKCLQAEMQRVAQQRQERKDKKQLRRAIRNKCGECLLDVLAALKQHPEMLEYMGIDNPKSAYMSHGQVPGSSTVPIHKKSSFAN
ncbi:MAG: hypothetical protein ACRCVX_15255 [Shewanella sp.]